MELEIIRKINNVLTFILTIIFLLIFIIGGAIVHGRNHTINEDGINSTIEREKQDDKALFNREYKTLSQKHILENTNTDNGFFNTSAADCNVLPDYIGEFTVTAYTAGYESTGKTPSHPEYGITASGAAVNEGITIASDWDVIPCGSWVYIEDVGYRLVQDKGGAIKGNKLDLYISDLGQALEWGVQQKKVWLVDRK